jgi:hypothetical protein
MSIPLETPLLSVESEYVPSFRGEELIKECGNPEASLRNLTRLLEKGLHVLGFYAIPGKGILVMFAEGLQYLAKGFDIGHQGERVIAFAKFSHECGAAHTVEVAFQVLSNLSEQGYIYMPSTAMELALKEAEASEINDSMIRKVIGRD